MKKLLKTAVTGLFVCASATAVVGQRGQSAASSCDRACLEGFVDRLLDAFVKHDPKALPMARNVKFTENGQRLEPGDGSWRSMVGKGTYRLFVSDPQAGQVAFIGTLREENTMNKDGALVLIALRLKIDNRQISEIEAFVVRNERAAQNVEKAGAPHRLFTEGVPAAERMSRTDLVKIANMYSTGMQLNDGKGGYPFADDCDRFENGGQTTNAPTPPGETRPDPKTASTYSAQWSCMEQFTSRLIHFVTRIHAASWPSPYGMGSGWSSWDDQMSDRAR